MSNITTLNKSLLLCVAVLFGTASYAGTCPQTDEIHFNMPEKGKLGSFSTDAGWSSGPVIKVWTNMGWAGNEQWHENQSYPNKIIKFTGANISVSVPHSPSGELESCNYEAARIWFRDQPFGPTVAIQLKPPTQLKVILDSKVWPKKSETYTYKATYECQQSLVVNCQFESPQQAAGHRARRR